MAVLVYLAALSCHGQWALHLFTFRSITCRNGAFPTGLQQMESSLKRSVVEKRKHTNHGIAESHPTHAHCMANYGNYYCLKRLISKKKTIAKCISTCIKYRSANFPFSAAEHSFLFLVCSYVNLLLFQHTRPRSTTFKRSDDEKLDSMTIYRRGKFSPMGIFVC